jgi:hypothetical protein
MTRLLSFALPLALCSGCFLVASTDDFTEDEKCDLELDIRSFAPHIGQAMELRLVQEPDPADVPDDPDEEVRPRLLFLGFFEPLQDPNMDIDIPGAVPALVNPDRPRPQLDFFADFNMDGAYSGQPADHSWRIEDPCDPDRDPAFPHNTNFADLVRPIGLGGTVHVDFCPNLAMGDRIAMIEPFDGTEALEVRVSGTFVPTVDGMTEEVRPVGFYRLERIGARPMGVALPQLVDPGFNHKVEIVADLNDDFAYDDGTDRAWVYQYNPLTAPNCQPLSEVCGITPDTVNMAPICKDGTDIRVRLSRTHIANLGAPLERSWVEVPEGT